MSIEPPLPAVSRPSNTTTMRWLVSETQRAIALSSRAIGFRSSSYSSSLSLLSPLISAPSEPPLLHDRRRIETSYDKRPPPHCSRAFRRLASALTLDIVEVH